MFASLRRVFIANVRNKKIWIVVYPLALSKNIYKNRERYLFKSIQNVAYI